MVNVPSSREAPSSPQRRALSFPDLLRPRLKAGPLRAQCALAGWLARDALWRFRIPVSHILMAAVLSIVCQLGAYTVLYVFARGLEQDSILRLGSLALPLRTSSAALGLVAGSCFLLLLLFAIFGYRARAATIGLRRRYEEFCLRRQFTLSSRLPHPSCPQANERFLELGTGKQEARACARVLALLLGALLPAGRLLVSFVILLMISPAFSAMVLLISLIGMAFVYQGSRAVSWSTRLREQHMNAAGQERARLLARLFNSPAPLTDQDAGMEAMLSRGETFKMLNAFFGRFVWRERTVLVLDVLGALVLLAVVLAIGAQMLSGTVNWALFVAYLAALRYYFANLLQLGRVPATVSRLHPQVQRYARFVKAAESAPAVQAPIRFSSTLALNLTALDGSSGPLTLRPGETANILGKCGPGRILAATLQQITTPGEEGRPGAYWFIGDDTAAESTLRQAVALPGDLTDAACRQRLAQLFSARPPGELLSLGLDEPLNREAADRLAPGTLLALGLLAALESGRTAVLFSATALRRLGKPWPDDVRRALQDRVTILKRSRLPRRSTAPDAPYIVMNDGDAVGWCRESWLRQHGELLERTQVGDASARVFDRGDDYEDEEEEDDE